MTRATRSAGATTPSPAPSPAPPHLSLVAVSRELPGGVVTAFVDARGHVRAAGYGTAEEVAPIVLRRDLEGADWEPSDGTAGPGRGVAAAMEAYAAGDLRALDAVPVDQPGTPLMQATWAALRRIEPGHPATYSELAAAAGAPRAVRAAASACARNRVALFVPCHRAIRRGGGPGGYAYGLGAKHALLAFESGDAGGSADA